MGLNVIRKDSVKEKQKEKTRKQLQEENEQLRAKFESLEGQLTDTQMALCDVYELLEGGEA
jgi:cell shape-determining protein MreC